MPRSSLHVARLLLVLGSMLPASAAAQNITLKTLPIPSGEQFLLFPSQRLGMGQVSIAADDSIGAAFSNPSRRLDSRGVRVYVTPTFYGESNQWVGGRSLPISALLAGDRVHGGFALALQQVDDRRRRFWVPWDAGNANLIDDATTNTYALGSLGSRLNGGRTTVGLSAFYGDLGAVDGVNMLYGAAAGITQAGSIWEWRGGLTHHFADGRTLEGTITYTRLDMTHDVHYVEWRWEGDPPWATPPTVVRWDEHNEDRTRSWGTQWRFSQPIDENARVGLLLAGTTKAHPKIPNYDVVNIPRDPGNSAVFNVGVGLSQQEGPITVGLDLIMEPGRSHTWALADTVMIVPGGTLQPGDKTVDNQFRFRNWNVGVGFEMENDRRGFQLGLRLRQINYTLEQENFLTGLRRSTRESFMEWTPSWSGVLKFGGIDLRYTGRFTAKGWPEMWGGQIAFADAAAPGIDFVVGATGPVMLPNYRVTMHRFTLAMPFGR